MSIRLDTADSKSNYQATDRTDRSPSEAAPGDPPADLSPDPPNVSLVRSALKGQPMSAQELEERTGLSLDQVYAVLGELVGAGQLDTGAGPGDIYGRLFWLRGEWVN